MTNPNDGDTSPKHSIAINGVNRAHRFGAVHHCAHIILAQRNIESEIFFAAEL